ncbi:MAG: CsgG/HfaB family protein [Thermodesulfobacteriota bacterium]
MKIFQAPMYAVILAALFFSIGCSTGESTVSPAFYQLKPEKLALVDISGDIRGNTPKNQAEDFFSKEMLEKGYRIIERSRVKSILKEQDFQHSDRTTSAEAAHIGRILNVKAVMMLNFTASGEKVSVTGKIVDTETAEVLWIGTGRAASGSLLSTLTGAAAGASAGALAGSSISDDTTATVAGAVGTGAVGGAAGKTLSPQEARVVQMAIEKMVEELPAKR